MRYYINKVWLPKDEEGKYYFDVPEGKMYVASYDFHPGVGDDPASVTVVTAEAPFHYAPVEFDVDFSDE